MFAIVILIIVLIKNIGKKEKPKFATNVIVNGQNITESLVHEPYINKDNVLYLSIEDVGNIFDKNIYYEEETKKIITTCRTKVAAIDINSNIVELNNANVTLSVRSSKLWR